MSPASSGPKARCTCANAMAITMSVHYGRAFSVVSVSFVSHAELGANQPFTRSTAPRTERASCNDGTAHRTDSTRCAGIIRPVVPRTVPRERRADRPIAITECSDRNPPQLDDRVVGDKSPMG
jgi:hypothetical protein